MYEPMCVVRILPAITVRSFLADIAFNSTRSANLTSNMSDCCNNAVDEISDSSY